MAAYLLCVSSRYSSNELLCGDLVYLLLLFVCLFVLFSFLRIKIQLLCFIENVAR